MSTFYTKKVLYILSSILFIYFLINTTSTITPFVTLCVIAVLSPDYKFNKKMFLFSFILGGLIALFNYDANNITGIIGIALAGGIICYGCLEAVINMSIKEGKEERKWIYLILFGVLVSVYLTYLFAFNYPGTVTLDGAMSLQQIDTGVYNNYHPFLYTFTLSLFKHNVLLYCIIQSIFMSAVIVYGIYAIKKPIVILPFIIIPYYMNWANSVIKDTLFACFVLLLIVSLYRIIKEKRKIDFVIYCISILGTSLYRLNGSVMIIGTLLFMLFILRNKKLIIATVIMLGISYSIKYGVPAALQLKSSDITESTTLMQQQIAYALQFDDSELSEKANEFFPLDKWKGYYTPYYGDSIKYFLRNHGYIQTHQKEYLNLWFKLGTKYPTQYLEAFIQNSRFYYNGAYTFDEFFWTVPFLDKPGIPKDIKLYGVDYLDAYIKNRPHPYLDFFLNIDMTKAVGFNTWLLGGICIKGRREKERIILIPFLMLLLTNIFLAPVPEFRYMLPLYFALPILFSMFFARENKEASVGIRKTVELSEMYC